MYDRRSFLGAGVAGAVFAALSPRMAFAKAEGLPLAAVVEALGQGAGSSWYFVNRAPFMVKGSYPAGFRVRLHDKDLRICRDMAARHAVTLPIVEATLADRVAYLLQGMMLFFGMEGVEAEPAASVP